MKQIVECIPNFSVGDNPEAIKAIVEAIKQTKGVHLLDFEHDTAYNRLVVTYFGEPQACKAAMLNAGKVAVQRLDMRKHTGQHPRIGVLDVAPFVPLKNITIEECIQLSKEFAQTFAEENQVPVYLYGEAAGTPEKGDVDWIRKGEWEALERNMQDPERRPAFGPNKPHPSAGATMTGAREVMVGLNINLGTTDLGIAKAVAKAIHKKKGGLVRIKAMGCLWEDRKITQIGITNTDFRKSPLYRQFELVKIEAARYGVPVVGAEFCGLVPIQALVDVANYYLRLEGFHMKDLLEVAIDRKLAEVDPKHTSILSSE
ncbi:MAG: glutamate formimidoyltransferase [Candidatus Thorarchaeota archaeon]